MSGRFHVAFKHCGRVDGWVKEGRHLTACGKYYPMDRRGKGDPSSDTVYPAKPENINSQLFF